MTEGAATGSNPVAKSMPDSKQHQPRIVLVAAIILVAVSLLVGVVIFAVMQRHSESLLNKSLQSSLQSRLQLTETEIRSGFDKTTIVATRPRFIDLVQRLNTDADDSSARKTLNDVAPSFLPTGLTAMAVFDINGRELTRAGVFKQNPALAVRLNLPGQVELRWGGQLSLHASVDMTLAGQVVGKIMTETLLPATTAAFKDANRLGKTAEMAMCAPFGRDMQCFPSTLNLQVFTTSRVVAGDVLLPMAYALDGKTGFVSTLDYRRQNVEAAYAPIGDLGLGMVLKIDRADLYAPVWAQLRILIPLLIVVMIVALLALRWLLYPLVIKLVSSEARIADLNAELEQRVTQRTAQLETANQELREFAYSVAHDLRQPFIAIGGFSGLLARSVKDERGKHYIARIDAGVRLAGELTDTLLELANLSSVELRLQEVDLSKIARDVMDELRQQSPTRQASVNIQSGLVARADSILIERVLRELLGNAWKFTSQCSQTEISFEVLPCDPVTHSTGPIYAVRDNGEGFDMAHVDKLFRNFQRLHANPDFPGSGVNLAKVQRIISRHGGKVWAQSVLGEGASFFFTLGNTPV